MSAPGPTPSSSSARPATWPTRRSFRRCRRWSGAGASTCRSSASRKSGWNLDQLQARAQDSLEKHGGLDPAAFAKLSVLLRYVDGDYNDPATFAASAQELGAAKRPAALPGHSAGPVRRGRASSSARSGCAKDARVIVEKPFGRDLASARELNRTLHRHFPEAAIFRIDHYLGQGAGAEPALLPVRQHVPRADLEPQLRRERPDHDGRGFRRRGAGRVLRRRRGRSATSCRTTCCQVVCNLAMEPPVRTGQRVDARREGEGAEGRSRPRAEPRLVRGQFRGYRIGAGRRAGLDGGDLRRAASSRSNSWRWKGVPFYIRAGKCLPVTCTEVLGPPPEAAVDHRGEPAPPEPPALPDQPGAVGRHRHDRHGADVDEMTGQTVGAGGEPPPCQPARRTPTSGSWATRSTGTRLSSRARTTSRRPGGSSTRS